MPVDVSTPRVKRLLYVGRIHPEKGLDLLIDAFGIFSARRRSQDWTLRLVGPWQTATGGGGQAYRDSLEAQARSLGLPVEFIGPIFDPAKLAEEYASASVFAYPSLAERGETFGLAVLEAMAAGLLPIVSGLACFRDFVDPGRTGFTFDHRVGGSANLAEALLHACSQVETDDGIALRMRLRAVADRFTVQAIADAHLRDFSGLLKNA
jgi:glycosyltransferase involved in cell wall biosynthesis